MLLDFLIPFIVIGLSELGDKTQLAILFLASKTKQHLRLLLGVLLAFIIADGLAIVFGDIITNIIPISYIKIGSGIIFIIFGIITLNNHKDDNEKYKTGSPFITGFTLILISEMGDKSQITAGLFAAQYNPWLVFFGVISALFILSLIAVYIGKLFFKKINTKTLSIIAGIMFIIIGIASFISI
ncbi:hypothetical protein COV16_06960 [Candidatus Woesearchaeota archaeon CG10_big_fil_rev_8_21_14_0_10_34_8]|nr:MAG: hypothetical protein COV16_06960 [Candidatus Woesearchaeota archaeon CG10_big_fil_rev_8_21_14_0_10_34_8]